MASKTAEKGERRRARSHAAATPAQNEAAVARPATFSDSKIGDHGIIPSAKNSEIMLMPPDMPESRSLRNPVTKTSRRETAKTVLEASGGGLSREERNLPRVSPLQNHMHGPASIPRFFKGFRTCINPLVTALPETDCP